LLHSHGHARFSALAYSARTFERVTGFDVGIVKPAPSAGANVIFGNSAGSNDSGVNVSRVCSLGGVGSAL
jgi:hypothetical protein